MKKLKLTNEQLENISFGESERFEVIEEGAWESYGKGETKSIIFKDNQTGAHYSAEVGRTGDHWNGYLYDSDLYKETYELDPCEQREVTTYEWCVIDGKFDEEDLTDRKEV